MVLAIAALFLQIAPVAHALPDVALGSTIPAVKTASADSKADQPKPVPVSSADKAPSETSPAKLTAASLETDVPEFPGALNDTGPRIGAVEASARDHARNLFAP